MLLLEQIEIPASNIEVVEHAQAPSPEFMEHPSLSKDQEAGVLESKDHGLSETEAVEDAENGISKCNATEIVALSENGYLLGEMEMKQAKSQGNSASIPITTENISADNGLSTRSAVEQVKPIPLAPECSNGNISAVDGPNRVEDIQNGVVINNEPTTHPVDRTDGLCAESPLVRFDETVASPSCSQVTTELEDLGRRTCSIDVEIHNNMGESCSPSNGLASNVVCPPESPGRPEVVNVEAQTFQEPKETDTLNHSSHEHMTSNDLPGLHACNTRKQPDMSSLAGKNLIFSPNYHL